MNHHDRLNRLKILSKTNGHCACCNAELDASNMTVDHYIPINRGGTGNMSNLYPLCENCNQFKTDDLYYWEDCYPNLSFSYGNTLEELYNQALANTKNEFLEIIDMAYVRWKVDDGYKEIRLEGYNIRKLTKRDLFKSENLDLSYSPKLISLYRIYPDSQRPKGIIIPISDIEYDKWIKKDNYSVFLEKSKYHEVQYAKH